MNILVYGFYGHKNEGDEMFKEAFAKLFPEHMLTFTDIISNINLKTTDAVFIGGGSMLDGNPNIDDNAIALLLSKPIFYIGVGTETDIHAKHQTLMRSAKLICMRTPDHIEKVKAFNANVIAAPDLVYSLTNTVRTRQLEKTVLVLPNINTVPCHSSPYWKHVTHSLFLNEIAQVLDVLISSDWLVRFYGMDQSYNNCDDWAAQEIINAMECRSNNYIIRNYHGARNMVDLFGGFEFVITQRYHGIVIAEMAGVPYISIAHHDKLMGAGYRAGAFFHTGEAHKDRLLRVIETRHSQRKAAIELDVFDELKNKVKEGLQTT